MDYKQTFELVSLLRTAQYFNYQGGVLTIEFDAFEEALHFKECIKSFKEPLQVEFIIKYIIN